MRSFATPDADAGVTRQGETVALLPPKGEKFPTDRSYGSTVSIRKVRFINPTVAIVDGDTTPVDDQGKPSAAGTLRSVWIVQKDESGWRIAANRNWRPAAPPK
jgi:hypothetical protein